MREFVARGRLREDGPVTLQEVLFSSNVAVALATILRATGSRNPGSRVQVFVDYPVLVLIRHFDLSYRPVAAAYASFFALSLLAAGVIIALLIMFRRAAPARAVLRTGGGVAGVGAAPACWLWVYGWHVGPGYKLAASWEVLASFVFVLLTLLKKPRLRLGVTNGALTAHFAFWSWFYSMERVASWAIILLGVGYASALVWAAYVTREPLQPTLASAP